MFMLPDGFWERFCEGCLGVGEFLKVSLSGLAYVGLVFVLPIGLFLLAAFGLAVACWHVQWDREFERGWSWWMVIRMILISLAQITLVVLYAILSYAVFGTDNAVFASMFATAAIHYFLSYGLPASLEYTARGAH